MDDAQLHVDFCVGCGSPLPAIALALRDEFCSAVCCRRAHGVTWNSPGSTLMTTRVERHGVARYRGGCRCTVCRTAVRDSQRAYRARRREGVA